MRFSSPQYVNPGHDGAQSYLVSMGDLLSGLLFLFIITLVVFSLRLKNTQRDLEAELERYRQEVARLEESQAELEAQIAQLEEDKRQLEELMKQLTGGKEVRRRLLLEIEQQLSLQGFTVEIDEEHGILRLPEDILFPSGSAHLRPEGTRMLQVLADVLGEVLPDYTRHDSSGVPDEYAITRVDAIFVEGHTDDVPVGQRSPFEDNWDLSTARAITTFKALTTYNAALEEFRNELSLPLFSVSGYADRRPVANNAEEAGRQLNRRIDLRFIMSSPKMTPEALKVVEEQLGYGN